MNEDKIQTSLRAQSGYIPTTIRIPTAFLEEIKGLATEIGDSQNGVMMHLLYMGMKVYKGSVNITITARND